MRVIMAGLIAAAAGAGPAAAEPSLFSFNGFTRKGLGFCMDLMRGACTQAFRTCTVEEGEVWYVDPVYNVSLGCDLFPDLGVVIFGVAAAAEGDSGEALRTRMLQMKDFIDRRL